MVLLQLQLSSSQNKLLRAEVGYVPDVALLDLARRHADLHLRYAAAQSPRRNIRAKRHNRPTHRDIRRTNRHNIRTDTTPVRTDTIAVTHK
eukprot:2617879-Rhodomonas_salina.1